MNSPDMQRIEHILEYCREAEKTVHVYGKIKVVQKGSKS